MHKTEKKNANKLFVTLYVIILHTSYYLFDYRSFLWKRFFEYFNKTCGYSPVEQKQIAITAITLNAKSIVLYWFTKLHKYLRHFSVCKNVIVYSISEWPVNGLRTVAELCAPTITYSWCIDAPRTRDGNV